MSVSQVLNAPDAVPVFTSTAPASIPVGATYTYQVKTTANPQATYSLITAPLGMIIDASTGIVSWNPTVMQAGLNSVTVRATNFAGSTDQPFSVRALTPAPTVPTGLSVSAVTTNSASLTWNPSIDSIGVAGYRVYRISHTGFHGLTTLYSKVADVTGPTATITGLNSGFSYQFAVSAYNESGNESGRSSAVSVMTLSPVVYVGPTSVNATANHPMAFTLSASANPAVFTFTALDAAAGMTVNPTSGLVSWTPTDADVGGNYFSFRINHSLGSVTVSVLIQVGANLPYANFAPGPAAIATVPYSATFSQSPDPNNTAPVSFSLVSGPAGMSIDRSTGVISWTPTVADIGTSAVTMQISNYAGSTNYATSIPVAFASPAQGVVISHIRTTSAVVSWSPPLVASETISGYHITASYRAQSGRFMTTHTLSFTAAASDTSLTLTALPANKSISVSVAAYDATNRNGLLGQTSFTTAAAVPSISVTGGPFTYDATGHAVTVTAVGTNGTSLVSGSFDVSYNGSSSLPILPGSYAVVATFTSADPYYAEATGSGTLVIQKATPTIGIIGGPFPYDALPHSVTGRAVGIDGVMTVNGSFTFTYNGSSTPPTNPGIIPVVASFTSLDPLYGNTTSTGTLVIKSTGTQVPVLALVGGPFTYDGTAHQVTATANGPGNVLIAGTFAFTYNGSITLPVNAGVYTVVANFTSSDPNYRDDTLVGSLTILKAVPTADVGWFTYPGWNPVSSITFDGQPHVAVANALDINGQPLTGTFSFTYATSSVPTNSSTYTVTANFTSNDPNYANKTFVTELTIDTYLPYVNVTVNSPAISWYASQYYATYSGSALTTTVTVYDVQDLAPAGSTAMRYYAYDPTTYDYTIVLASPPVNAGNYLIQADFVSSNSNYSNATGYTYLEISPADVNISVNGTFNYDGLSHSAQAFAYGVDGLTPVAGTFAFIYNGLATPPTNAGSYIVDAVFTSTDPNYNSGVASGLVKINKITPSFRGLNSPTINAGTATATLTGILASGVVYPTGELVSILFNSVTRTARVSATGTFSVSVPTSTLAVGTYPITLSFAGNATGFNPAANASATLTVIAALVAPSVTTNPASQSIRSGDNVTFTAAATGNPLPNVQWQVSTNGGTTYTNVAGATSTSLTLTTSASQNGNRYRAVFTNSVGTATTTAATLTVQFAPTVTTNPSSQTIVAGRTVTFSAAASGNPTPTVQWQASTNVGSTFTNIAGATSTTLTLTTTANQNGYHYHAVFTNSIGTATTSDAVLTVQSVPVITTNPFNQTVVAGGRATFVAAATSNPTPTVQWQVSTDGGVSFTNIAGATTTTLSFTVTSAQRGNRYRAVFTNALGSAITTSALLTV